MRRRPGIGGLQTAAAARVCVFPPYFVSFNLLLFGSNFVLLLKDHYRALGENVAKLRTDLMKEQLATFRSQLEEFARKHKVFNCFTLIILPFFSIIAVLILKKCY